MKMNEEMTQHEYPNDQVHPQDSVNTTAQDNITNPMEDNFQTEKDKQLIRRHPLFPLLELLFDKCERATRGEETPTSSAYDEDIQEFVHRHEAMMSSIYIDHPDVDNLMVKAVQVLRIHLLELEKVNELCKDFCNRYITCLKGKMHSENLLRSEVSPYTEANSQHPMMPSQCMANTPNSNVTVNQQGEIVMQGGSYQQHGNAASAAGGDSFNSHQGVENGIDGSTPLSQVGISPANQYMQGASSRLCGSHPHASYPSEESGPTRKTKRGVLPKHATEILRSWLFSHIVHAYPTEDEKRQLATQTNLTLLQVNNWFINARRRILQPMLDASNPDPGGNTGSSSVSKAKKPKQQRNRTSDRFWQNSIGSSTAADENMANASPSTNTNNNTGNSNNVVPATTTTAAISTTNNDESSSSAFISSPPSSSPPVDQRQLLPFSSHSDGGTSMGATVPLSMVNR